MPKEPLYPHRPKRQGPLYPHVTRAQPESQFVKVGDRVRFIDRRGKYRRQDWPEEAWLEYGVEGTVTEYHPRRPALTIRGEFIEGIEPWAVVAWDNGTATAIDPDTEGERWEKIGSVNLLAATETDPKGRVTKYCCRICGECAPKELLEEGRFLDRISWLRNHYKEKHPGMWGRMAELPATIPAGDRQLLDLVNEPLPKDAY